MLDFPTPPWSGQQDTMALKGFPQFRDDVLAVEEVLPGNWGTNCDVRAGL